VVFPGGELVQTGDSPAGLALGHGGAC
jgi:hypothetical protein